MVHVNKLQYLKYCLNLPHTIHYGYSRGRDKLHKHFLCAGVPLFVSPTTKERCGHVFGQIRYPTRRDRMISAALRKIKSKSTNKCSVDTESEIITSSIIINETVLTDDDNFVNNDTDQRQIAIINEQISSALS